MHFTYIYIYICTLYIYIYNICTYIHVLTIYIYIYIYRPTTSLLRVKTPRTTKPRISHGWCLVLHKDKIPVAHQSLDLATGVVT